MGQRVLSLFKCFTYLIFLLYLGVLENDAQEAKTRKINYKADLVEYDKEIGSGAMRLLDHVTFEHEGVLMDCDSAYLYTKTNTLEAFYNIHINQGDSLHLYGDYLEYDGNSKLAKVRSNVLLENSETRLITNALDYHMDLDFAYYGDKATILNGDNELNSEQGYYYAQSKSYLFQDSVVLINPDYIMYSDTLKFNTITNTAFFLSATNIISDSNTIYCERGWYNTETNISEFTKNSRLENNEQILSSDTLFFDRNKSYGIAKSRVSLFDKEQDIILKGNYALNDQVANHSLLTDSAVFIVIGEEDSLYLHADTLLSTLDTLNHQIIKAYYGARVFRNDLQAVCDSLVYSFSDSIISMFDDPVIWSSGNQLSADFIEMLTSENQIEQIIMNTNAFIISEEDTNCYNQIKGKDMLALLHQNELYRIDVNGNGQTVYYVRDESDLIGLNYAESSNLTIFVSEQQIDRINFQKQPDATMHPIGQLQEAVKVLDGFRWLNELRPVSKHDIFRENRAAKPLEILDQSPSPE
jgi:lipopolysaccharide export system protein LptA